MINLRPAKSVQGAVTLPVSPDLLYMAALGACAAGRAVNIQGVDDTDVVKEIIASLNGIAEIRVDDGAMTVIPKKIADDPAILLTLPGSLLPYQSIYLFMGLGMGKTVVIKSAPQRLLDDYMARAKRIGITIEAVDIGGSSEQTSSQNSDDQTSSQHTDNQTITGLRATYFDNGIAENSMPDEDDCSALIAYLLGKGVKFTFTTSGYHISTPLRPLASALGLAFNAKLSSDNADPIMKRMRFMQGKQREHQDQTLSYTIDIDFSSSKFSSDQGDQSEQDGGADTSSSRQGIDTSDTSILPLALPGDELLAAALITLKCLVPRGDLEIKNVPLEPWAAQTISFLKKMNCKITDKDNAKTSFGTAGTVVVQKSECVGRKTRCLPAYQYITPLPCMAVAAAFAEGKSVFRELSSLRLYEPDGLDQLERSLRPLGVRHGEMPDGIVVEGAREFDGFDILDPLPAHIAAAFCVAGLKCMGKTSIADEFLFARWPKFEDMINEICEFRNK